MARSENLAWNEVDVDTLSPANKKLYKAYKEASAEASERRKLFNTAFEKAVRAQDGVIAEDQTLLVTHKFGKLSFAVSDEAPKQGRAKGNKFSFS